MSNSAQKTALNLNFESEFTVNRGLRINPLAQDYQGVWTAAAPYDKPRTLNYGPRTPGVNPTHLGGTVNSTNCTGILTFAISNFNGLTGSVGTANKTAIDDVSIVVYRNLIKIGRPNDSRPNNARINCPALGNSRPDSFISTYPGFGSFQPFSDTDKFLNRTTTSVPAGMIEAIFPPYNYPASPDYSYVYINWGSKNPSPGAPSDINYTTFTPWQQPYQYLQNYSWVTGWPGRNDWQEKQPATAPYYPVPTRVPQTARDPEENGDNYAGAYFPRPDLASVQPWRERDKGKIEYDEYFGYGFIATVARQAYYEFWSDHTTRRPNQYIEFSKAWQQCAGYQEQANKQISSFVNTKTFLKGTYSNINDLTTSDLAGVNLAFRDWGSDMIALGRALDLSSLPQFGLPSKFLLNLQTCNALTDAVRAALLLSDLSTIEVQQILLSAFTPDTAQERKIYNALTLIQGQDLLDVKIILNCTTGGLTSLADLINPQRMFPNSYPSLTVPEYTLSGNSSKIYRFVYNGGSVNPDIQNWGEYLDGILSPELALACGAFMMAMNQVKNITNMDVMLLSQVIYNLEVTNKDLPLVNSADGVPGSVALANQELDRIALGSGSNGVYRFGDFFGAMSGWPYRDFYAPVQQLLKELQTEQLFNVYRKLYQKSLNNDWALIGRGKGYADASINTTGIDPQYAYNLFTVAALDKPYNPYYIFSDGSVTATINTGGAPINQNNIFTSFKYPARPTPGYVYDNAITPGNYQTGQILSFISAAAGWQAYVVNASSANTVTFQSLLNYNPTTQSASGGVLSGNTVTYTNVPSNTLSNVGPEWRLDRAYVTSRNWVVNPVIPNPGNLGTLTITLDTGGYPITQTTTYNSPYPYRGWPGLSQEVRILDRVYINEWEYNGYPGNGLLNGTVQNLIDAANLEILRIQTENPEQVSRLNYYWDQIGRQMAIEQRAIPFAITSNDSVYTGTGREDLSSFTKLSEEYAQNTGYCETAPILEAISDNQIGGQSVVASEREARNARRLLQLPGIVDNDVPSELPKQGASARTRVSGGSIQDVEITASGSGYDIANPPVVVLFPNGGAWGGTGSGGILGQPVIDRDTGAIVSIPVISGGSDYSSTSPPQIYIQPPPNPLRPLVPQYLPVLNDSAGGAGGAGGGGAAGNTNLNGPALAQDGTPVIIPGQPAYRGSFSGLTPAQIESVVPNDLTVGPDASYSVAQAQEEVTNCNCDCWDINP